MQSEQLEAFRQAFEDRVDFPVEASVQGEAGTVLGVDYEPGRRLMARRIGRSRRSRSVDLVEVRFRAGTPAGRLLSAYVRWLGEAD